MHAQTKIRPPFEPWKGLHSTTKRLADGTVKKYWYAWKGGPRVADDGTFEGTFPRLYKPDYRDEVDRLVFITSRRAKNRKQEYTITAEWIAQAFLDQDGKCAITGIPFDLKTAKTEYTKNPKKPSIDRIDSKRGYTPDNCRIVLCCVNLALNEWGLDNFMEIARAAVALQTEKDKA